MNQPSLTIERPAHRRVKALVLLMLMAAYVIGTTRGFGWVSPLPHSPFPQPLMDLSHHPDKEWQEIAWLPCLVPSALCALLAWAAVRLGSSAPRIGAFVVIGMAAGELSLRLCGRLAPSIYAVTETAAVVALLVHVLSCVGFALLGLKLSRCLQRDVPPAAPAPVSAAAESDDKAAWLRAALPGGWWERMEERGLSSREALVICAELRDMSSAQAAEAIGIGASTVREYRSRIRKKLGIQSFDQLGTVLSDWDGLGSGNGARDVARSAPAHAAVAHGPAAVVGGLPDVRPAGRLGYVGSALLLLSVALVLAPMPWVAFIWNSVWATSFGLGIGLAAWLAVAGVRALLASDARVGHAGGEGARLRHEGMKDLLAIIVLLASVILAVAVRGYLPPIEPGRAVHKTLTLLCSACLAFACCCLVPACLWTLSSCAACAGKGVRGGPSAPRRAAALVASAALVVLVASWGVVAWACLVVLSTVSGCALLAIDRCRSGFPGGTGAGVLGVGDPPLSAMSRAALTPRSAGAWAAVFMLAALWEESWRGMAWESLAVPLAFAVLLLTASALLAYVRLDSAGLHAQRLGTAAPWFSTLLVTAVALGMRLGLAAAVLWAVGVLGACAYVVSARHALPAQDTFESAGASGSEAPGRVDPLAPLGSLCAAAAAGLLGTPVLVNAYGWALLSENPFGVFSGRDSAAITAGVLVVLLGAALSALWWRERAHAALQAQGAFLEGEGMTRTLHYLAARGLTQEQADAAVLVCRGKGVAQIAHAIVRSRSGAWAVRSSLYERLGVSNPAQLVALLKRETSAE